MRNILSGEWNTLDLYCHGDTIVQVVNGRVMMNVYHLGQADNGKVRPLTKGRIQLQSEGAEVFYKAVKIRPLTGIPGTSLLQTTNSMRRYFLPILSLFAALTAAQQADTAGDMDLYLLIGQSNMAGRAPVDAISKEADPRIFMLDKENNWAPATDPMHFDKPALVGVGPGLSFAKQMLVIGGRREIGLIPCAVGGSPIRVWEPDSTYLNGLHPYDDAIRRTRLAMRHGILRGIIWHQGESDNDTALTAVYMGKLKALIERLRRDLGRPDLPFVAGEIGYFDPPGFINRVIDSLPDVVSGTAVVSAEGLTDKGDNVHFDTRSARELGRRYAQAMAGLEMPMIQHVFAREEVSLDGRWNYIVDPYENGFYDYCHMPYDQSPSGKGGFYDNRRQTDKSQLIEYDFDGSPTLKVPGDWNSQDDKLLFYEGTVWYRKNFQVTPQQHRRYFLYFGAVNYEAHIYLNGKKLGMFKGVLLLLTSSKSPVSWRMGRTLS